MKHSLLPVILLILSLLAGCTKGDISNVRTILGESVVYTPKEITDAMDVAIARFQSDFEGCSLLTMEYIEESSQSSATEWAETYGADEAIVLLSSFDVAQKGADGGLTPGHTYRNWQWVLVRSQGGSWELKTWGYG